MSWFIFSIITLLCWSGSDFFSKIGCRDASDKYSHLKMVMAVGIVMGLHAAYEVFVGGVVITWDVILTYLPVSLLYILSMAMGYIGLRYIELSISSPICNASGALVAIIAIVSGIADPMEWPQYLAIALAAAGVIGLGFVEANEDEELRAARQEAGNFKYAKSWLEMGISEELIGLAYEKTCVNTGGLSWPYMNKILSSWHAAGYKTAADVQNQDRKTTVPKGASGELGQAELEAIRRVLQEG